MTRRKDRELAYEIATINGMHGNLNRKVEMLTNELSTKDGLIKKLE